MYNVWTSAGLWLGLYVILSLAAWALLGPVEALLLFALLLGLSLARQLHQLSRILAWAKKPAGTVPPESRGAWDILYASLAKRVRTANGLRDELSNRIERFRDAWEAMPDGVVALGPGNLIEWFNSAAAHSLGLRAGTDVGAPFTNLVRRPELAAWLDAPSAADPLILASMRDGEPTLSVQVVPFGSDQKLILARDITQLGKLERMRSDFVANVSHELKTPLTVVSGFIETLLDFGDELPPVDRQNYLQLALDQSRRMQHLVDDLLTLSALETGAAPAVEDKMDVAQVMADIAREAEALSAGRHRVELVTGDASRLKGSAREIRSALANLASNAVRYTPESGHITLAWRALPGGELEVSVTDDGIGIAPEHLPRLTERFYRVDRGRSRETGGTGLGLAIVKHVLTRHQAELRIESEPGKGSRFAARFPAVRVCR